MNKRKKTGMYLGKVMCKFAETFAPQASELCRGQYYQPKEPDKKVNWGQLYYQQVC